MAQWYIMLNGEQVGPTDAAHLSELVSTGRLRPTDMVWSEGMANWQQAVSVPELASLFSMQPAGAPAYGSDLSTLPTSGMAIASLVLGIVSIPTCVLYGVPALICGPLAIIFSGSARKAVNEGRAGGSSLGLATAGKICGIIGLCLGAVFLILVIIGFATLFSSATHHPSRF